MENMSTQELETLLNERLEAVKLEKAGFKDAVDSIEAKIRTHNTAISVAPKETEQEITVQMQKLERTHSTTSQTTIQERQFMRDMDKLRLKKKALAVYMKVQSDVEALRAQKNVQLKEMHERETLINELFGGLRKVKLAQKLSCNLTDLFEQTINIEESKIARVVGKGGQNLRNIESECGVSLDMDRVGGGIHIMGTRATIELALDSVMSIVDTAIEEFTADDVIVICLLQDKQLLVNEIQAKHHVRLDISRAKNHIKVSGLVDGVLAAKAEILAIQGLRQTLQLQSEYLPFIIGKGGVTITGIEDDNKVSINLNRDKNELEVLGLRPNVLNAMTYIKNMIDQNKEVEEVIRLEKHVLLGCLIGSQGAIIKSINKDFGVHVVSEGAKDDQFQSIRIKGTFSRVEPAKRHIMSLVTTFIANTLVVEVADEYMAVLLGKAGENIKKMRVKYPTANIDIDKNTIHIQSTDASVRALVKRDIDDVIEANYNESLDMSEDCIIQLKSQRGYNLREELLNNEFKLKLIMDKATNSVKLRGAKASVKLGMQKLQAFKDNFTTVKISIHEEDYPIFFKNGNNANQAPGAAKGEAVKGEAAAPPAEDSLLRAFELKYDIEILAIRKELSFVIRGSPHGVAAAKAAVEGFLAGNPAYGAVLVTLETLVYSALIGKNGSNIKKMEEEHSVKFDILKSRNLLRIRGDPAKITAAKHAVLTFIDNTRVTDHVTFPASIQKAQLDKIIKAASEIYQLELHVASEDAHRLVLKGIYSLTEEAKVYLRDHFQGTSVGSIKLLPKHMIAIGNRVAENFKRLHDKYGVTFELNSATNSLDIRGATASVYSAKADAMKFLETFFGAEVHVLEVSSPSAFRDVLSYNLLSEVQAVGAQIFAHRAINRFFVLSETPAGLALAKSILQSKLGQWSELNESVDFEEFMYPMIIGKAGAAISALCKETHVSIEINRSTLKLELKGATKQIVQDAKETITKRIEKLRSEHWEVPVSGDMIGLIIGKQGTTINKIRAETGANVDFDAKLGVLRVSGGEDKVGDARIMIEEIIAAEEKNKASTRYVSIPAAAIPCVIGTKGSTSKEIQNVSGARLDVDRINNRCVLKGSEEACAKAAEMIEELLDKEGYTAQPIAVVVAPVAPVVVEEVRPEPVTVVAGGNKKVLPGANPEQLSRAQLATMSKSAQKRWRKKQQSGGSANDDEEDDEVVEVVTQKVVHSAPPPLEAVEEEEEPVVEEPVVVKAPSPVVPPEFISAIPTPAPVIHAPVSKPSLVVPAAAPTHHHVGVPSSPVRVGAPVAVNVPFNFNNLMGKPSAVGVIGRSNSGHTASPPALSGYSSFGEQSSFDTHLQQPLEAPIFVPAVSAPVAAAPLFLQQPPAQVFTANANGTAVNAPTPVRSELFSRLLGPTTPLAQTSVLPVYKPPQQAQQQQQQQPIGGYAQQQQQQAAWGSNASFTGTSFIQQQQQLHQQQMQLQQQQAQLYMQQQQFAQAQHQFAQQHQMPQPPQQQQQNYNGMLLNNQQQQQQFPPLGAMRQQQVYQQAPPGMQNHAPPGLLYSQQSQQGQGGPNVGGAIGNGVGQYSPEFMSSLCQPSGPAPAANGQQGVNSYF